MIKSLKDARIVDGLPRILAKQPWVRALSDAMGVVHEMTMAFVDHSQIYTDIDNVTEDVLDALAANWKVNWYSTDCDIKQKRQIIKTALKVRRNAGTAAAVKDWVNSAYDDTNVIEWWEYGGEPGCFKVETRTHEIPGELAMFLEMLGEVKRLSAHLEKIEIRDEKVIRLYIGFAIQIKQRIAVDCEIPPDLDAVYLTDENGELLVSESGAIIVL